jgi:hypothetical protein
VDYSEANFDFYTAQPGAEARSPFPTHAVGSLSGPSLGFSIASGVGGHDRLEQGKSALPRPSGYVPHYRLQLSGLLSGFSVTKCDSVGRNV